MHRVLELELEQTNNVYTDHATDTSKQISSADSSNCLIRLILLQLVQAIEYLSLRVQRCRYLCPHYLCLLAKLWAQRPPREPVNSSHCQLITS